MKTLDLDAGKHFSIEQIIVRAEESPPTHTIHSGAIVTVVNSPDITTFDCMNAVEVSGVLDFWNDPEEDNYNDQDGDAI